MILKKIWFLRYNSVELRDGPKFGSRGGFGANVGGGRGWYITINTKKMLVGDTYYRVVYGK